MTAAELTRFISTGAAQDFLKTHASSDPQRLLLASASTPWKKALSIQLALRKKLERKLPEWTACSQTVFPTGVSAEQCSSEATARLKASLLQGEELLDMTGGMGVDAFYLSDSFHNTTYVEQQKELVVLTRHNFQVLKHPHIHLKHGDGMSILAGHSAEVVYVDPARRNKENQKQTLLDQYTPNVLKHLDLLTLKGRKTLIKTSPMLDLSQARKQLQRVSEIWVISHRNECKEVLYLLSDQAFKGIRTYNIHADNRISVFNFTDEKDADSPPEYTDTPEDFLFEPNASILKAQGTKAVCRTFGLRKMHPNTQLLTGPEPLTDFPGKVFKVMGHHKPYAPVLKKEGFNIVVRNYPDRADFIGQRLKIKPSLHDYLLAYQTLSGRYLFTTARRIH